MSFWFAQDKLKDTREEAAELSVRCSKMEESSSSLSRQQFGTRVKKLQRTTGVARDLALKCRIGQARKDLLGRLARQLSSNAFAQGAAGVLVLYFDVSNHEVAEWNETLSSSIREAVLKWIPEVTSCCASWDVDNKQLVMYIFKPPLESEFAESDSTSRLASIVEETIQLQFDDLQSVRDVKVLLKGSKRLSAAEIETPLDLWNLGIQSHGLQGSALTIDWVEPGRWAHVFGLQVDDVVIFANNCATAEMSSLQAPLTCEGLGLKLCLAREG